jgi:outer membrane lipoprotein-sorting protein
LQPVVIEFHRDAKGFDFPGQPFSFFPERADKPMHIASTDMTDIPMMRLGKLVHSLAGLLLMTGILLIPATGWPENTLSAQEIVERADEIRFPQAGFQVEVRVVSVEGGGTPDTTRYRILSKGNDKTLVMTTHPAKDRGQIMLMRDNNLWVFMPRVSQPVRLPLAQRLTGQVANGDLARANFAGDYDAKLLRVENQEGRDYYVVELTANNRQVTYHRVLYWVDRENFRPMKAEFYTLSNNLLKIAHYRGYQEMAGLIRPTQLIMQDALKDDAHSLMEYSNMQLRDIPERFFDRNYLNKLQ